MRSVTASFRGVTLTRASAGESFMRRDVLVSLSAALCAAASFLPLAAHAAGQQAAAKASVHAAGKAPAGKLARTAFGQPDISGAWTNVSMTPESRPANIKGAAYTLEEAAKIEGAAEEYAKEQNQASDPNAGAPKAGGEAPKSGTRSEFASAGGAVGGYDYGWLDPGTRIGRVNGEPRTSVLTTPDGRAPKVKAGVTVPNPYAGLRRIEDRFNNPETMSLGERCIMSFGRNAGPPMLANGFYNNNYEIVQGKDQINIVVEMVHDVRQIRLNSKHRTDGIRPWMGDSIGHWEGETLVVETTNIPQGMAYHGSWKNLTVTERFTRKAADRLLYQFTINDPDLWDAPWGGEYEFRPLSGHIYEYACHEGNYALEHMLAGAREEEKRAAAGTPTPAATGQ
jgi:hypothetical protein